MTEPKRHFSIAVIGTGFAGLGMALQLRRRGVQDFVVFERAQEVGGTWRDNTYPGCGCDIKSDLYSFSFVPNPDWSRKYAAQPEILAYLKRTAQTQGVTPHIRFGHEVRRMAWDDAAGHWQIQTSQGDYTARVIVAGSGPLIEPKWPQVPGLGTFTGEKFHSARWRHDVELRGKRVAVIGTGASAIQFIPRIQPPAEHLTVFQRTPAWVLPRLDAENSEGRKALFRRYPALQRLTRQFVFARTEARFLGFAHPRVGHLAEEQARAHLEAQVPDPELRRKLTPNYRLGCKRVLISDDFYPAIRQPNVTLVDAAVTRIDGRHLHSADGGVHEADVLICGTGFEVTEPPYARLVYGRGGQRLADAWAGHMEALHGTAVAGFPNFFLLVGPNSALGHNSIIYMIEAQLDYILGALHYMDGAQVQAVEPNADAQRRYNDALQHKLQHSVWVQGGCQSYYLDAQGRNSTLWPELASGYRWTLRRFPPEQYDVRLSPQPPRPLLAQGPAA